MTDAENLLWRYLRNRNINGFKFRRQHPIENYVVDFVCLEKNLIIEVDGGQHSESYEYDQSRTNIFNKTGYKVLRFWNNEVLNSIDVVLDVINKELENS